MLKSLGNSYSSSGNRVRFAYRDSGKSKTLYKLVTWSQKRCKICQRFLSIKQQKYCDKCAEKVKKEQDKGCNRKRHMNPDFVSENKLRSFVYRNADKLNVGDII